MADPDRLIIISANIDKANAVTEDEPPPFPDTGGDRLWYIAPDGCYDDPEKRVYKPGQKRVQYPNFVELWLGWPSIKYVLPNVDRDDYVLIMEQFSLAKDLDGWVWFSLWNGQTRTWKLKRGIMEFPTVGKFSNSLYKDVELGFSNIRPEEFEI